MNHSQRAPRQRLIVAALALVAALTTAQGVLAQGIEEITPNYRETDILIKTCKKILKTNSTLPLVIPY